MKVRALFVALAAVFAFSATAQEQTAPDCEAVYTEVKAALDAQDAVAGNLYECFAKDLDLSTLTEETTEEELMALIIGTCGSQIEAFMAVFDPSGADIVLQAGFEYQICKMQSAGN